MAPKVAVTPEGSPEAVSATAALKPFCGFMVMVLVPLAPGAMPKLAGDAESVKLGGGMIVSETLARLEMLPDLPVMVIVDVPGAALAAAENVTVAVRVEDEGLNAAVTPAGRPLAERLTVALKPPTGVMVIVLAALAPATMLRLAGAAAMVKPDAGAAATVRLIDAVACRLPDFPVTVTVAAPVAASVVALSVIVLA